MRDKRVIYNVKPVLEGKDFEEAEKLYQQKLKEHARLKSARKIEDLKIAGKNRKAEENNKRIDELN
ncbi:MAG: hypothetical protein EOO81_08010, partial [Oxalobacteraceae bacterium]